MREVVGSNPNQTKNQGLKITGKDHASCELNICLSLDDRVIGGDVKPLALSPTFVSCLSRRGR